MLDLADARAVITTSLSDADLSTVIARQEAWLAKRIGPLDGERTETFIAPDGDEVLQLQRPAGADSITVTDDAGAVTDYALRGWSDVVRTAGTWDNPVSVVYTPDDGSEVENAIITLVRLALGETAYASESFQGYSATSDHGMRKQMRWEAWRSLLRPSTPETTRLKSAIPAGGNSVAGVAVASDAS